MKIIKPEVNLLWITPNAEKMIERAGRVCYKSEDLITEESSAKFIQNIIKRGHEAVIEHASASLLFICDRGVTHELVRHRLVAYCISGDSIIFSTGQKKWTIKELYEWQNDSKRSGRLKLMNIRSINENNNTIIPNNIKKVFFNGKKEVYKLTTESGRSIKTTKEHKFYSPKGYKKLKELSIGDFIFSNGKELLDNEDWLREYYLEKNLTRKQISELIGCCETYVFKAFKKFNIFKPWSDRPNRKAGHGKKGMFSLEEREKISNRMSGENNHRWKGIEAGGYVQTHRIYKANKCDFCGSSEKIEVHHIDKNSKNISKENIKFLCCKCHNLWHNIGTKGVFKDKIISIEYIGEEDVYDIEMSSPYNNYVTNGLVVHNCQESTRYCNYSKDKFGNELTFIEPCFWGDNPAAKLQWENFIELSEDIYLHLIKLGATPQEARSVLPNSLKTEIVATANMREFRLIFKLRCSPTAHPQIRQIMLRALKIMYEQVPTVFTDLYFQYEKDIIENEKAF